MSKKSSLVATCSSGGKHPDIPPESRNAQIVILEDYRQRLTPIMPTDNNPDNEILYFPLTVDSDLSAEAQNIIRHSCGTSVSSLKLEPLPIKHQTKIWVSLQAAAFSIALHAIILGLPGAELGMVKHVSAPQQIEG